MPTPWGALDVPSGSKVIVSAKWHEFKGRNNRLDGPEAAVLNAKLLSLDGWIEHRKNGAATPEPVLDHCQALIG